MILTAEIIESGKSRNGGWNKKQLQCLGIKDFKKGWKRKAIGRDLPEQRIEKFLALRDAHLRK